MHRSNGAFGYGVAVANNAATKDRRLRILIVDDEPRFRKTLSSNLVEEFEAIVTDVGSGRDAIHYLKAGEAFDLIFLDLRMPDLSGTETYRELKKIDAHCSIIMMSSLANSHERLKASQLNAELVSKSSMLQSLSELLSRATRD